MMSASDRQKKEKKKRLIKDLEQKQKVCAHRESNARPIDGNDRGYHYPMCAFELEESAAEKIYIPPSRNSGLKAGTQSG